MSGDYGQCTHCGSNLTPADFQLPACRYCGTAFRHHQEAAAKVAELQAVMGMMRPQIYPGMAPVATVDPSHAVVVPGMVPIQHASARYVGQAPPMGQNPPMGGGPMPMQAPVNHAPSYPGVKAPATAVIVLAVVVIGGLGLLVTLGAIAAVFLAR